MEKVLDRLSLLLSACNDLSQIKVNGESLDYHDAQSFNCIMIRIGDGRRKGPWPGPSASGGLPRWKRLLLYGWVKKEVRIGGQLSLASAHIEGQPLPEAGGRPEVVAAAEVKGDVKGLLKGLGPW